MLTLSAQHRGRLSAQCHLPAVEKWKILEPSGSLLELYLITDLTLHSLSKILFNLSFEDSIEVEKKNNNLWV